MGVGRWHRALVLLTLALARTGSARAAAPPEAAESAQVETSTFTAVALELEGVDAQALVGALALRAPALDLSVVGDGTFAPEPGSVFAYITVRPVEEGFRIDVSLSDGRGYRRRSSIPTGRPERVLASDLASLLDAIASGGVVPDRRVATIPEDLIPAPAPERDPEPLTETEAPPAPEAKEDPPSVALEPDTPPMSGSAPGWGVGLGAHAGLALGLLPAAPSDGLRMGAGALGPWVRAPGGWVLGAEGRLAGRTSRGIRLLRGRFVLAGGYAWQRRAFALPVVGFIGVEVWRVDQDVRDAANQAETPLMTFGARLSPGWRTRLGTGRTVSRLGGFVELAGALRPADGQAALVRLTNDGAVVHRIGGLEILAGIDLAVWFRARRDPGELAHETLVRAAGLACVKMCDKIVRIRP
ncbi:MAG: hypothetical protein AAGF11_41065 [Myxococcota bacterium]